MVEQRLNYFPDSYQDDFEELKKQEVSERELGKKLPI